MRGYVLREGEGRSYTWNGFDFTVKAGHPEAVTAPDDFSRRIEAEGEPVGDASPGRHPD